MTLDLYNTAPSDPLPGRFIVLEGPDGAGKTDVALALVDLLRAEGHDVLGVRDPGSAPMSENIRAMVKTSTAFPVSLQMALFIVARLSLVRERILPALTEGRIVVADRFAPSTLVYQGYVGGMEIDLLCRLNRDACGIVRPTTTAVLDVPRDVRLARMTATGRSRDSFEEERLLASVEDGYERYLSLDRDALRLRPGPDWTIKQVAAFVESVAFRATQPHH